MRDAYRYVIHAYEDARQRRPIKHQHGGTAVLTDGADALARAQELARVFPDGWVYIHVEHRGERKSRRLSGTRGGRRGSAFRRSPPPTRMAQKTDLGL